MKALITGATGFLGGWLTERLVQDGHDVRVLCRDRNRLHPVLQSKVQIIHGDVVKQDEVMNATKNCELVFHLAGYIGYKSSERKIMEQVNVLGTKNVVEACVLHQVKRLIHMSSVVAIGASFTPTPLNENSTYNLKPYNFGYPETKREAELLVMDAVKTNGLNAIMLNPSTIYGARDATKGSRNTQLKVAKGKFPFYTHGGVSVVDVRDIVEACVTAIQQGKSGERYILSGENVTIQNLFQMIAAEAGVKPPQILLPNLIVKSIGKFGDFLERHGKKGPINSESAYMSTMFHWFDNSKAKRELGFKSRPAIESIRASVSWMKEKGLLQK